MCGSSKIFKIFLMPPMSFGVQTRVTGSDPCGLPLPQDPSDTFHHFHQILAPWFPQTGLWNCPGCGAGNLAVMFLMRLWDQLASSPADMCLGSAVPPSARPWAGTWLVTSHGRASGSDLGNNCNCTRTAFSVVDSDTSVLDVCWCEGEQDAASPIAFQGFLGMSGG